MSKTPLHPNLLTCDEMLTLGMPSSDLLEVLEDELGPEAVWKLTGTYGGRSIYVPQKKTIRRAVTTERLGVEIVTWLHNRLGHGPNQIPMGPHSRTAKNLAAFRAAFLKNKSQSQIAKEMDCHIRTVERMASRMRDVGFL